MPLTALLDCFLLNQRLRGNSPKTIHNYESFIKVFFAYLDTLGITTADALTIHHVNAYQLYLFDKPSKNDNTRRLAPKTVQTLMRHIKIFLRFCFNEELIRVDIAKKMVTPKANKPVIEILTDREADTLLNSFNTRSLLGMRNYCLCFLMLDCGLRLSEARGLRVGDLNLEVGYAKVTGKGDKSRIVPLGLTCRQNLTKYLYKYRYRAADALITPDDFLFLSRSGSPLTQPAVILMFRKLKKRLAIPRLHAHLLRHTFATNFLLAGLGDVYQLAQLLGHESVSTTEIYLHAANYYRMIQGGNTRTYRDTRQ